MRVIRHGLCLCLLLTGCSATAPGGTGTQSDGGSSDAGTIHPVSDSVNAPTLDETPPNITPYSKVRLRGQGPAGGSILVEIEGGKSASYDASSTGAFCGTIELIPTAMNKISLRAIDKTGLMSAHATEVLVQQDGTPATSTEPPSDKPPMRINMAKDGTVTHSSSLRLESGSDESHLTDGVFLQTTPGEYVEYWPTVSELWWVAVKLKAQASIDKIDLMGPDSCAPQTYYVLASDQASPPAPSVTSGHYNWEKPTDPWHLIKQNTSSEVSTFVSPSYTAKHVAFVFAGTGGCDSIHLSEIAAYTVNAPSTTPTQSAEPSCGSGG